MDHRNVAWGQGLPVTNKCSSCFPGHQAQELALADSGLIYLRKNLMAFTYKFMLHVCLPRCAYKVVVLHFSLK